MHPIDHIKKLVNITPDIEERLLKLMHKGSFRKGETIRGATNLSAYSYYICRGATRQFITVGGKEHTFAFNFADQFIVPSLHALRNHPDTISVEFLEDTDVIYIPQTKVKTILTDESSPDLLFLNTALSRYASALEEKVFIMQALNATERYNWLIEKYPQLPSIASATQIASFLGLTRETLSRIRNNNYIN